MIFKGKLKSQGENESNGCKLSVSMLAKSWLTLCHPMDCSSLGFPVLHYLLKFAQTYVDRVDDAV